ncbi:cartilage acidic protein 1-like [Arapaima gigas]
MILSQTVTRPVRFNTRVLLFPSISTGTFSTPSLVRTVIEADFEDHSAHTPEGLGEILPTGATATDFDGDGRLNLPVAHGESTSQPVSVFRVV